ncbi:hypothetical protein PIB30_093861, partial [Stylosanthes scabra]|nr:hypothetical protein [Stylosanthes scabra]
MPVADTFLSCLFASSSPLERVAVIVVHPCLSDDSVCSYSSVAAVHPYLSVVTVGNVLEWLEEATKRIQGSRAHTWNFVHPQAPPGASKFNSALDVHPHRSFVHPHSDSPKTFSFLYKRATPASEPDQ